MFELPDYTGRDPEYIQSSLTFYLYHARQTLRGRKQKKALEVIRAKAEEYGVDLPDQN